MKYELIVSENIDERVVIYARERTPEIEKIISLIEEKSCRIIGYTGEESVYISPEEIECITVIQGKTTAITKSGNYLLKERLYSLEEELGDGFVKINKSSLANIKNIHSFGVSFGGALMIKFKSGYRDYVSRRQQKTVKEKLK